MDGALTASQQIQTTQQVVEFFKGYSRGYFQKLLLKATWWGCRIKIAYSFLE